MTELYLHQLWQLKRFPFHRLKTIKNQSIQILEVGTYNTASGPDFFNGKILIDGVQLSGNIEMHLKSSDWYAHKHQLDPAYNNVILHVVLIHDKPVTINNQEIPTLELGEELNWLGTKMPVINNSSIPCGSQISTSMTIQEQLEIASMERLNRKAERFKTANHPTQAFFETFVEAFGRKVNAIPFLALAQKIRIELLLRMNNEQKKAMILGCSGFMENHPDESWKAEWKFLSLCHNIDPLDAVMWQTKGNRPASFPEKRLLELAEIVGKVNWLFPFWEKSANEIISYWRSTIHVSSAKDKISEEFLSHLLINAVVPYLAFLAGNEQNSDLFDKATEILLLLKTEKNAVVSKFSNLGVKSRNAKDSQALIELYNNWCTHKKCLLCTLGNEFLYESPQVVNDVNLFYVKESAFLELERF